MLARAAEECRTLFPKVFVHNMRHGFNALRRADGVASGGMHLGVNQCTREPINDKMPWHDAETRLSPLCTLLASVHSHTRTRTRARARPSSPSTGARRVLIRQLRAGDTGNDAWACL